MRRRDFLKRVIAAPSLLLAFVVGSRKEPGQADRPPIQKATEAQRTALLDDSEECGSFAAPAVFDDAIILTPILHGELRLGAPIRRIKDAKLKDDGFYFTFTSKSGRFVECFVEYDEEAFDGLLIRGNDHIVGTI